MKQTVLILLALCTTIFVNAQRKQVTNERMKLIIQDASYLDSKDGSIYAKVKTPSEGLTYVWTSSNGYFSMDSTAQDLAPGTYLVHVFDGRCVNLKDTVEVRALQQASGNLKTFRIHSVNPNPFLERMNVSITSAVEQEIRIDIFRANGQLHSSRKMLFVPGENNFTLDLGASPAGIYVLNFCNEEKCKLTEKVVKL